MIAAPAIFRRSPATPDRSARPIPTTTPARAMLLGVAPADPGWDDGALAAAAAPFDVVLASDPVTAFGTGE